MVYQKVLSSVLVFWLSLSLLNAQQVLSLKDALASGVQNYGSIKSKKYVVEASSFSRAQAKRDYLPNLVLSGQQVYGTINGQNGPLYGFGGFGVASSGLPLNEQNWNAAFGALYLANVNWEFFTFGKARGRINVAQANLSVTERDYEQELFQHQVRIAAAYLNVLATQRLALAQQKNLNRALVFERSVSARAKTGLIAGVDSSLANAEVSNAKIALIKALDLQQEETKKLAVLTGQFDLDIVLDSSMVSRVPIANQQRESTVDAAHPLLSFYRSRVDLSAEQTRLFRKNGLPSLTLFGVFQQRASGFDASYVQDQTAFSQRYSDGVTPTRGNYLIGVGLAWNITSLTRASAQSKAQNAITLANQSDLELANQQLSAQLSIADSKYANALRIFNEAPIQVYAASNAYNQKNVLYKNGLTNIVEVTQTLYALNRAETDRDLAYINVWQALLLKAAATGDLSLFTNEL
jgi:outer membrane protein TolC